MVKARPKAMIGARINIEAEDVAGRSGSLMKSLIKSSPSKKHTINNTTLMAKPIFKSAL